MAHFRQADSPIMDAARAARLVPNDNALFVDRHSVAVTGQSRDDGFVCVTNRYRWVGDPRWGAFVVYSDGRKIGVAPLHGSLLLRELPPGNHRVRLRHWWYASDHLEISIEAGTVVHLAADINRSRGHLHRLFRMLLRPVHSLSLTQEQTPGNVS
jgi:hypothetical protein